MEFENLHQNTGVKGRGGGLGGFRRFFISGFDVQYPLADLAM